MRLTNTPTSVKPHSKNQEYLFHGTLVGHTGALVCIAATEDGKLAASRGKGYLVLPIIITVADLFLWQARTAPECGISKMSHPSNTHAKPVPVAPRRVSSG